MKLEFNVLRMTNEDVIATSGVCSHIGSSEFDGGSFRANHIYVEDGEFVPFVDANLNGELDAGSTVSKSLTDFLFSHTNEFALVTDDGWYYFDGTKFEKCDENCSHPKEK